MKFPLIPPLLSMFISASLACAAEAPADSSAPPPASAIKLRVEQENKVEQSKDRVTKTQTHSLKLYLANSSHEDVALKIKFAYFGHGVKDHNIYVVSEGTKDTTMKPASTTEEITAAGKAVSTIATKKAPASGDVLVGYGVQIFRGDTLVAESYEPGTLKGEMGKAPPVANAGTPAAKNATSAAKK